MEPLRYPCPHCTASFSNEHELFNHALNDHQPNTLIQLIRGHWSMKRLTKDDFLQVDSQWIFAVGGFHMSLLPNRHGDFSLQVYGSIEPIPKATQYPSEPEWDRALELANKFLSAYQVAVERDSSNATIEADDSADSQTDQAPEEKA